MEGGEGIIILAAITFVFLLRLQQNILSTSNPT